jgi:hypothetical protein
MDALIFDNFLPFPDKAREWALSHDFYDAEEFSKRIGTYTSWPGIRTDHVMDLDRGYADVVLGRFAELARTCFRDGELSIRSYFQVCREQDGDSWIHQDNDVDIAAVLYLNPYAPVSAGTSLYRCNDIEAWGKLSIDDMKKINRVEKKELYDNMFTPVDIVGNVYNRLIMYKGDIWHKSNDYFGSDKYDGRLTQVFFLKYEK